MESSSTPLDFTATNGTSVVLASGAAAGDVVNIYAFKSFTTADMVSKSAGGTFAGAVNFGTAINVDGHTSSTASVFEANGNGDQVGVQLKVKANNGSTSTQGLYGNAGSTSAGNTIVLGNSGSSGLLVDNDGDVGIGAAPNATFGATLYLQKARLLISQFLLLTAPATQIMQG